MVLDSMKILILLNLKFKNTNYHAISITRRTWLFVCILTKNNRNVARFATIWDQSCYEVCGVWSGYSLWSFFFLSCETCRVIWCFSCSTVWRVYHFENMVLMDSDHYRLRFGYPLRISSLWIPIIPIMSIYKRGFLNFALYKLSFGESFG